MADVRPDLGAHSGGEALKSQFVTSADVVALIDADLTEGAHIYPRRSAPTCSPGSPVPRLLRPSPDIDGDDAEGGRVIDLWRPWLTSFVRSWAR